ncbi:hypothetical protein BJ170DRAFT_594862 [Xylariales sp. AK1849]|nr:hypothetical protein BJ170DRAFT_594862 [Xylariales sp. AK1849]
MSAQRKQGIDGSKSDRSAIRTVSVMVQHIPNTLLDPAYRSQMLPDQVLTFDVHVHPLAAQNVSARSALTSGVAVPVEPITPNNLTDRQRAAGSQAPETISGPPRRDQRVTFMERPEIYQLPAPGFGTVQEVATNRNSGLSGQSGFGDSDDVVGDETGCSIDTISPTPLGKVRRSSKPVLPELDFSTSANDLTSLIDRLQEPFIANRPGLPSRPRLTDPSHRALALPQRSAALPQRSQVALRRSPAGSQEGHPGAPGVQIRDFPDHLRRDFRGSTEDEIDAGPGLPDSPTLPAANPVLRALANHVPSESSHAPTAEGGRRLSEPLDCPPAPCPPPSERPPSRPGNQQRRRPTYSAFPAQDEHQEYQCIGSAAFSECSSRDNQNFLLVPMGSPSRSATIAALRTRLGQLELSVPGSSTRSTRSAHPATTTRSVSQGTASSAIPSFPLPPSQGRFAPARAEIAAASIPLDAPITSQNIRGDNPVTGSSSATNSQVTPSLPPITSLPPQAPRRAFRCENSVTGNLLTTSLPVAPRIPTTARLSLPTPRSDFRRENYVTEVLANTSPQVVPSLPITAPYNLQIPRRGSSLTANPSSSEIVAPLFTSRIPRRAVSAPDIGNNPSQIHSLLSIPPLDLGRSTRLARYSAERLTRKTREFNRRSERLGVAGLGERRLPFVFEEDDGESSQPTIGRGGQSVETEIGFLQLQIDQLQQLISSQGEDTPLTRVSHTQHGQNRVRRSSRSTRPTSTSSTSLSTINEAPTQISESSASTIVHTPSREQDEMCFTCCKEPKKDAKDGPRNGARLPGGDGPGPGSRPAPIPPAHSTAPIPIPQQLYGTSNAGGLPAEFTLAAASPPAQPRAPLHDYFPVGNPACSDDDGADNEESAAQELTENSTESSSVPSTPTPKGGLRPRPPPRNPARGQAVVSQAVVSQARLVRADSPHPNHDTDLQRLPLPNVGSNRDTRRFGVYFSSSDTEFQYPGRGSHNQDGSIELQSRAGSSGHSTTPDREPATVEHDTFGQSYSIELQSYESRSDHSTTPTRQPAVAEDDRSSLTSINQSDVIAASTPPSRSGPTRTPPARAAPVRPARPHEEVMSPELLKFIDDAVKGKVDALARENKLGRYGKMAEGAPAAAVGSVPVSVGSGSAFLPAPTAAPPTAPVLPVGGSLPWLITNAKSMRGKTLRAKDSKARLDREAREQDREKKRVEKKASKASLKQSGESSAAGTEGRLGRRVGRLFRRDSAKVNEDNASEAGSGSVKSAKKEDSSDPDMKSKGKDKAT